MLQRLCIDNYKHLVNFGLPHQKLTLLIAANSAGGPPCSM